MAKNENPVSPTVEAPKKNHVKWWQTRASILTSRVLGVIAIISILFWLFAVRPYMRTDDARVAADIIRIANRGVTGLIEKVNVTEGDIVTQGMVLIELDHRAAESQLKKAQAKAIFASAELNRMESLAMQNSVSRQQLDRARSEALSAAGDLKIAELALEYTTLKSPANGIVIQKTAQSGNILETNQTAIIIADIDNAWISANIEETSVSNVKTGQKVTVYIDEGGSVTGKVQEVRTATASTFAFIPSDNTSGNFIKLIQRIPVKIKLDPHPAIKLRVGQSVEIKIHVM